jgi:hypothetical protein
MDLIKAYIGSNINNAMTGLNNAIKHPDIAMGLIGLGENLKKLKKKHRQIILRVGHPNLSGGNCFDAIHSVGLSVLDLTLLGEDLERLEHEHNALMHKIVNLGGNEEIAGNEIVKGGSGNLKGGNFQIAGNEILKGGRITGGNFEIAGAENDDSDITGSGIGADLVGFLSNPLGTLASL